jgi:hypothetical protein
MTDGMSIHVYITCTIVFTIDATILYIHIYTYSHIDIILCTYRYGPPREDLPFCILYCNLQCVGNLFENFGIPNFAVFWSLIWRFQYQGRYHISTYIFGKPSVCSIYMFIEYLRFPSVKQISYLA